MKRLLVFLLFVFTVHCVRSAEKSNVLFVISDDLNYALSGHGHPECKTPNLDEFAKSAVSFTRAYCQFPLCGPSRASIMSGRYPFANGVTGNGGAVKEDRVTLPKHFRNHGYWSARVSKIYHMGIPGDIIQGTSGEDHAPSWNVTHNIAALESMTPGKIVDYFHPDAPEVFPEERLRWKAAHENGEPYKMRGQARPADPGAQGVSLTSLMNEPDSRRPEKPDALIQVGNGFGLRSGMWAYMWYPAKKKDPEAAMLYDMETDPKQFTNLVANPEYSETVDKLHRRLMARIEEGKKKGS